MPKEQWNHNRFAAFCEFFKAVNCNFLKLPKLSPHIVIDETLYSHHGRISFKQYNPSKPAKYGLLLTLRKDSPICELKSTKWCHNGKKVLLSYADETKTGTKIVLALTTMFDVKPECLVYYDHMKGSVDMVDLVPICA